MGGVIIDKAINSECGLSGYNLSILCFFHFCVFYPYRMSASKEALCDKNLTAEFLRNNLPLEFALVCMKIYARFAALDKNKWARLTEIDKLQRMINECFNKRGDGWLMLMNEIESFYSKFVEHQTEEFINARFYGPTVLRLGEPNIFNEPAALNLAFELHMAARMYQRLGMKVGLCKTITTLAPTTRMPPRATPPPPPPPPPPPAPEKKNGGLCSLLLASLLEPVGFDGHPCPTPLSHNAVRRIREQSLEEEEEREKPVEKK